MHAPLSKNPVPNGHHHHPQPPHHQPPPPHHQHHPNGHAHPPQNNNNHHSPANGAAPTTTAAPSKPAIPKEPIVVVGIPSVSIQGNRLVVGDSQTSSTRSYTPLKVLGDGTFGTVWLCDWHGTLPPNTPLSPMQCGGGARPEWTNKRLVAVKRMKKRWEGGWDEAQKLKELESLRAIPFHPNIIPLYDFFLLPASKELYFVFESMEGNLYHLIRARKGRPLAGGLVCSIFGQIVSGLHYIHVCGYFHRDMKPENVLVTTTGLFDYVPVGPHALPNSPPERDVVTIVKLADFGLARETKSKPPYTEYVSTRWYRAPEVLLLNRDYSVPVDMWALGTIMAELVNLRPLFPGSGQLDQIHRICEVLGDPSDEYGVDNRGKSFGGGKWSRGIKMGKAVGFQFPKTQPKNIFTFFDKTVPIQLIECIADLLKYDPDIRLNSLQCVQHPYLLEIGPRNKPPMPPGLTVQIPGQTKKPNGQLSPAGSMPIASPRSLPPSHSHHSAPHAVQNDSQQSLPPFPMREQSLSHRASFYPTPASTSSSDAVSPHHHQTAFASPITAEYVNQVRAYGHAAAWQANGVAVAQPQSQNGWAMEITPQQEHVPSQDQGQPMDIVVTPAEERPSQQAMDVQQPQQPQQQREPVPKLGKLFQKKNSKWDLGRMFGGNNDKGPLPPVDEVATPGEKVASTSSLKRHQPSSSDSVDMYHSQSQAEFKDPKKVQKEARKMQLEAEQQRRKLAEKMHREQARAVIEKRNRLLAQTNSRSHGVDLDNASWNKVMDGSAMSNKQLQASSGPVRGQQSLGASKSAQTLGAASGHYGGQPAGGHHPSGLTFGNPDWHSDVERYAKARRRDHDDDHSMSNSDVHSIGPVSNISFATVDSDPGPGRLRHPPSLSAIRGTPTSTSSLRTSYDAYNASVRSFDSISQEQHLAHEFNMRAAVSGSVSPPPINTLSLSGSSPNFRMQQQQQRSKSERGSMSSKRPGAPNFVALPPPPQLQQMTPSAPSSPFEYGASSNNSSMQSFGPMSPPINPMFKVPPLTHSSSDRLSSAASHALPSFSHLEAVAEGEYPPLSPMSFHTPDDEPDTHYFPS